MIPPAAIGGPTWPAAKGFIAGGAPPGAIPGGTCEFDLQDYYYWLSQNPDIRVRAFNEWLGLLRSCSALESYCRHYTADLRPERIAEFLLLNSEFPRSVRFAAARVESALRAIASLTTGGAGGRAERLAGRLHASLDYGQVDEILSEDPHVYLETISRYCAQIHGAVYQGYITYPIESALPA